MKEEQGLHAGHRSKMLNKFFNNPDAFCDHELLEMLLFNFIPRRNTNDLAHLLINHFGGLKEVFDASPEDIATIRGVGIKTATSVSLLGKVFNKIHPTDLGEPKQPWLNLRVYKQFLIDFFARLTTEKFMFICLDDKYRKIAHSFFDDNKKSNVSAEIPSVMWAIARNNPTFAIIAHNHTSGSALPSEQDDKATAQLTMICSLHNVKLLDHVIVSNNDVFSYRLENRLDLVSAKYRVDNFVKIN